MTPLTTGDYIAELSKLPEHQRRALAVGLLYSLPDLMQSEVVAEWSGISRDELCDALGDYERRKQDAALFDVELPNAAGGPARPAPKAGARDRFDGYSCFSWLVGALLVGVFAGSAIFNIGRAAGWWAQ